MKTLANCTTAEFLRQTNKIRKAVSDFLTDTKILDIRKNQPEITEGRSEDEKRVAYREQAKKKIADMHDRCLDEHAEKTISSMSLLNCLHLKECSVFLHA